MGRAVKIKLGVFFSILFIFSLVSVTYAGGDQNLTEAARSGNVAKVNTLLAHGADVNAKDIFGDTALTWAAEKGYPEVVKALLAHGADINAKEETFGNTALMEAALFGHPKVVKILLTHGANVNAKDNDEEMALMKAASEGHFEVVKILLANGADVNAKASDGWTALTSASEKGNSDIAEILLAHGADVNAKSNTGVTALMLAAMDGHPKVIKTLLAHGVDVNVRNRNGDTALSLAAKKGYSQIVQLLKQAGASEPANSSSTGRIVIAAKDIGPELGRLDAKITLKALENGVKYEDKILYICKYQVIYIRVRNNSNSVLNVNPNYFTLISDMNHSYSYSSETYGFKDKMEWLSFNPLQSVKVYPETATEGFLLFRKNYKDEYPKRLIFQNGGKYISTNVILDEKAEYGKKISK